MKRGNTNPFLPPEASYRRLAASCKGHPRKKAQISFRMLPPVSRRMSALDNFHALNPSNFIESEHNTQLPVHFVGGQQFPSTWRATLNSHHRILATLRFRSTTTDKQS